MIRRYALIALAALLPAISFAQAAGPQELHEGREFSTIIPTQPMAPSDGKIEVVEVFGYACIHCANFQPLVNEWKKKLADDVNFAYMPMSNGGAWEAYGRAFYAAQSMGIHDKTHDALFKAIHIDKREFKNTTDIAEFYGEYGVDAKVFESTMNSFAINAKVSRAKQIAPRWAIQGTPSLVIDGKYRVMATPDGGLAGMLNTANILIERERQAMKAAAAAK